MAELTSDCPRCGATHTTMIVAADTKVGMQYGWKNYYEAFCICRACKKTSIFLLSDRDVGMDAFLEKFGGLCPFKDSLNKIVQIERHISTADKAADPPPEYIPAHINDVFVEGTKCLVIGCYNAAAAMFRLCLDFATHDLLPKDEAQGPPAKVRRSLGLRLTWLLDNGTLPEALRELSTCIKEDGNDGAHEGTLNQVDAEDIKDFTFVLLERLYTEPARVQLATERRLARRQGSAE